MRYFVNENCIACGLCASLCPEVFELQDDGFAKAINGDAPADAEDAAQDAMHSCPSDAIEEA